MTLLFKNLLNVSTTLEGRSEINDYDDEPYTIEYDSSSGTITGTALHIRRHNSVLKIVLGIWRAGSRRWTK